MRAAYENGQELVKTIGEIYDSSVTENAHCDDLSRNCEDYTLRLDA